MIIQKSTTKGTIEWGSLFTPNFKRKAVKQENVLRD